MMRKNFFINLFLSLALSLTLAANVRAEDLITRVFPPPNALNVRDTTKIVIIFNFHIDATTLKNDAIKVSGSQSGLHPIDIAYDAVRKTATVFPQSKLLPGEVVNVIVKNSIKTAGGAVMPTSYQWRFTIAVKAGAKVFAPTSATEVNSPYGIVAGDFDRDGDLDLAVTSRSQNKVAILKNDGYGGFTQTSTALAGSTPGHLTAGDFDGDGDLDLAVANTNGNTVSILKNDGTGIFKATAFSPTVSSAPLAAVTGDFDGDGDLDLAVSNYGSGGGANSGITILMNNSAAGFQKTSTIDAYGCEFSLAAGDWDDDGDVDLAVSSHCLFGVSILNNDGKGNFNIVANVEAGAYPSALAVGDLNGDGDVDLVTPNRNDASSANSTVSILSNRRGDFKKSSTPIVAGAHPGSVAIGDFDQDGRLDLAVANNPAGTISILLNDSTNGHFKLVATPPTGSGPDNLAIGDFDGDGDLDLAATNSTANLVTIVKNGLTEFVKLTATAGNNQRGVILTSLKNPLVVTATDAQGKPASGVSVNFVIASAPDSASGYSFSSTNVTTNNNGQASVVLKLGSKTGTYTVNATSGKLNDGVPITFTATAVAGAASGISYASGDRQVGKINTALAMPLVVNVVDIGGNPVAGASVNFAISNVPSSAAGQSLGETNPTTNSSGQATTVLKLGNKTGDYKVNAFLPGNEGSPVTFTATAETGNLKTIKLTAGNGQNGLIKTFLANPLEVTITDEGGNPVAGVSVTFAVTKTPSNANGYTLNPAIVSTNNNGKATTTFTLGNKAGAYGVTATATNVIGSPIVFSVTASAGAAAKISLTSGNNQTGSINTSLSQSFVTTVTDIEGNPVPNVNIAFAIKAKPAEALGESLSLTGAKTDTNGRAETILAFGNKVGIYTVTASANGLSGSPLEFTATAKAGAATTINRTSGNAQTAPINTVLNAPFVVTVMDAGGNPVQGVMVVFEVDTLTSASKGNLLSRYSDTTGSNGQASTVLTLGSKIGAYRVRAAAAGLIGSPIEFAATAIAGAPAKISHFSGNAQTGKISTVLAKQLVAKVVDEGGNPVAGVSVSFAFASVPNGATGQSLNILNTTTNNLGRASTFLTLGDKAGIYKVTATANGLIGNPITFTATADLNNNLKTLSLVSGNNQTGKINTTLNDSFVVKVTDATNNPVAGINVTFALATFPNGATGQSLSKTFAATGNNGQAAIVLQLGNKAGAYTVAASSAGLLNSPIEFTATATNGPAANLRLIAGDDQADAINTALQKPFVVTATDAGGNPVAGAKVNFAIFSFPNGATGQRLSQSSLSTDNNGQAATILTLGDKLGNYSVTATLVGLNASTVSFTARAEFTGRAEKIVQAAGNNRDGQILTSLSEPFVVTVTDNSGNPIADYTVAFNIEAVPADATRHALSESLAKTDKDGRATTILTLGSKIGTYKVSAIAPKLSGSPVTFTARATPGSAATMSANTGDNQIGKIKKVLANPFILKVTDTEGNSVAGVEVSFAIKAPSGANGHSLDPVNAKTDELGGASTILTLGDKVGKYVVEAASNGLFPVRFSAQANSDPPSIATPSLPTSVGKAEPAVIRANISDDLRVAEAKLFFRKGGETSFTETNMSNGSGNTFQGEIPANVVTSRGLEFFISAKDEDGNSIRQPLTGIMSIQVNVNEQGEKKPSAQPANSYRLISVPLNLVDKTPKGVLEDDLDPYDPTKWRFYALPADQSYTEFPNGTMEPGKAFWLIVKTSGRRIRIGPGTSNSTAAPYVIPLHAGWNFIGNPFNFPTKAKSQLGNGAAFGLYSFDGAWSDPQNPDLKELQPFDGYAVFTRAATTLLINSDRSATTNSFAKLEMTAPAWAIRIIAECGNARDSNNLAAIASGSSREWDQNDFPEPPVIGDYVSVYFPHPEWGPNAYNYCTDVRPLPNDGEVWEFAARSNMHDKVQLNFADVENVPPEFEAWLIDEAVGLTQNLRATNRYAVAIADEQHPKRMKLLVGKHDFVAGKLETLQNIPATYELSQNFPNPFNPATTIRYGLPQNSRVTLKVFNPLGEEVNVLVNDEPQIAGYHAAIWDGRSQLGAPAASGLYFYQLHVGDFSMTKKMLLVK